MDTNRKEQMLTRHYSGTANSEQRRTPASWNQNRFTAKLGIEYPIIQGPLGGLSSQRLTSAVSNFGGLGSFGAHSLPPDAIKDVVAEIRSLTSKPFAMNLWVSIEDEGARTADENGFNRSLASLVADLAALGAPRPTYKPYSPKRFEDQARVLLDANVPAFSFIFGIPARDILKECRARGIVTIGTATSPDEAAALREAGVDAVVAFWLRSRGASRLISSAGGGLAHRYAVASPTGRRHRRCASDCRGWNRRCTRGNRRPGSWRRGRPNGNGIPVVRGIRHEPPSSRNFATTQCRTHCLYKRVHRKTRTGNLQRLDGEPEPKRNRGLAISAATRTRQKSRNRSRGCRPCRSRAYVGRAKRQSLDLHRRIDVLDLIGRGAF